MTLRRRKYYLRRLRTLRRRKKQDDTSGGKRIARKTVRYFPLTPRLQYMYMSDCTAKEMRWHGERITKYPEFLRYPADGEAWKDFDR